MNPYIKRKIIRKQGTTSENIEDYIAVEKRLRVAINGKNIISLYCTPLMIKELVIGFLYNEGILVNRISPEHIKIAYGEEINVDINAADEVLSEELATSRYLGGISFNKKRDFGKVKDNFRIAFDDIKNIFVEFQEKSEFFKLTGCFHSAALSDGKRFLFFAEDIGRHNVVDKLTGYSIMENIPLKEKMVLVSCRLSSEIVSKCSMHGVPIIASRSAPTDLAVEIAESSGVTLVGFLRGDRMNIYANAQRIIQ